MRAKVRMAGKTQPMPASGQSQYFDIVEIPVDKNISDIAICESTGNFAISVEHEVKVFHIVQKDMPNSDIQYQDVEIFLEMCWNFSVKTLSLCEEYLVCASHKECQAIRLEYAQTTERIASPVVQSRGKKDCGQFENEQFQDHSLSSAQSPSSVHSQSTTLGISESLKYDDNDKALTASSNVGDFSSIGMSRSANPSPAQFVMSTEAQMTEITDDKFYKMWRFDQEESETDDVILNLPSLQGRSRSLLQKGSPPVLQDLRGEQCRHKNWKAMLFIYYK